MRITLILILATLLGCHSAERATAPHFDIGVIHRAVTTVSPDAQLWFDRGLGLAFGFNHEEAIDCFKRAAEVDPSCAMAWWGQAWAHGTNYNSPTMPTEANEAAWSALQRARDEIAGSSAVERALIEALGARYSWPAPKDRKALEIAYADAMRTVRAAHPLDPEVTALTAEAMMQQRPWELWSHDGVPAPELAEIRSVLETGLARWPNHPALCHMYIHAMEAGPEVALAIPAAEALEGRTPGLGHLVHMPSHAYVWTGRYDDVIRVNIQAVEVDDAYARYSGREGLYTAYRVHNYHFVAYGAMWEGRRDLALEYSRRLVNMIPDSLLASMPDLFEVFTATPYHVMVRFGMWDELLEQKEPKGDLHAARAVWRYSRALAYASLSRVEEAKQEQQAFLQAMAAVPESRMLFNNPVSQVLEVAKEFLDGEIEYRCGNYDRAFDRLREAVRRDEQMNYDEPWGWMEPPRHALGALLTEQGRFAEAETVYRANLARYPDNGWALHGLSECIRGLGRNEEADAIMTQFEKAWARADIAIPGSCFCRTR